MKYENCLHHRVEKLKPWAYNKVKAYGNITNLKYLYDA